MRRGAPGAAGISRPSHGVLAPAWAMLIGPPGTIGHIDADLNDPSALPALFWLTEEHARSPTNCSSLVMNSQISLFMYPM